MQGPCDREKGPRAPCYHASLKFEFQWDGWEFKEGEKRGRLGKQIGPT